MYDCCITWNGWQHNKNIFLIFETESIPNALIAGLTVRKIVSGIRTSTLNIFAHSLGAAVANEILFNNMTGQAEKEKENMVNTPSQPRINICLLAPAISSDIFKNMYDRNSQSDFRKADNYRFYLGFNNRDFALLKKDPLYLKFGPGPKKYGITTLGCNYDDEIEKLEHLFKSEFPSSTLVTYNMTGSVCHYWRCYHNKKEFKVILEDMWESRIRK